MGGRETLAMMSDEAANAALCCGGAFASTNRA